jgi:hypothetical protein
LLAGSSGGLWGCTLLQSGVVVQASAMEGQRPAAAALLQQTPDVRRRRPQTLELLPTLLQLRTLMRWIACGMSLRACTSLSRAQVSNMPKKKLNVAYRMPTAVLRPNSSKAATALPVKISQNDTYCTDGGGGQDVSGCALVGFQGASLSCSPS